MENFCYYPPPPTESIRAKLGLPPKMDVGPYAYDSSYSIHVCCSSCGVSVNKNNSSAKRIFVVLLTVHKNMSSAKRRLVTNSSSIFTPMFSQFHLQNMNSSVATNSFGQMMSPCVTPLLILIFSLSLCRSCQQMYCHRAVSRLFRISMYKSSIPYCSCNDVNISWVCAESNTFS